MRPLSVSIVTASLIVTSTRLSGTRSVAVTALPVTPPLPAGTTSAQWAGARSMQPHAHGVAIGVSPTASHERSVSPTHSSDAVLHVPPVLLPSSGYAPCVN